MRCQLEGEKPLIYLYLFPHNPDDNHDWTISTEFEFGIVHPVQGSIMISEAEHTFRKQNQQDGYSKAFRIDELDEFVREGSVEVFVNLKANKLTRSSVI